jgi:phage-related protein
MAANKSIVSAADLKNLKDFNKEASNITTVLKELADALGKNAKEAAKFTGESAAAYEASFSNAVNSAKELAGYTSKQLADTKKEAEFNRAVLKTEQDRARVQAKISELKDFIEPKMELANG